MNREIDAVNMAWDALVDARKVDERVDEIALLFHSSVALDHFLAHVPYSESWDHFDSVASDTMKRKDKNEEFVVRFEFLRPTSGQFKPWRIEAMCVLSGDAPLHKQAIAASPTLPCVVHASYKTNSLDEYQDEVRRLWSYRTYKMEAEYINTYGMFSYWRNNGGPYLKPRVNLRDGIAR